MSASPDDPDFLTRFISGINNGLSSPTGLLALSLLNASGPSRMPVSTGQALAQGFAGGQGMEGQVQQNKLQRLMYGFQLGKMDFINKLQNGGQPDNSQPSHSAAPGTQVAPSSPDADVAPGNSLLTSGTQLPTAADSPQASVSPTGANSPNPLMGGDVYSKVMGDPLIRTGLLMGAYGLQGGDKLTDLGTQRMQLQNMRGGSILFDPATGKPMFRNPNLPVGATLDDNGNVVMVPGASSAIIQSGAAQGTGKLFGQPEEVVDSTGQKRLSTAGNVIYGSNPLFPSGFGGNPTPAPRTQVQASPASSAAPPTQPQRNTPQRGGNVTELSPSVTAGMEITGKQAAESANEAVAKQASFQQQLPQLNQLQANLAALDSGPGEESQLAAKGLLASVPGFFGIQGTFNADLTNAAAVKKTIVNMVAPAVRAMGAREPVQMVNFIRDGMASITNPADANAIVIGMLRGVAEYGAATGQYAGDFLKKNNGAGFVPGKGSWQSQWQSNADPGAYIMENLPPFEQQAIIKEAHTNSTIRAELQRMQKSGAWLQQNGYIRNPDLMGQQ